jgi:formylmethanofuran dehydrogenase subunit D
MLGVPPVAPPSAVPADGGPAIRLVTRRTLWDGGTLVQSSAALAGLHPEAAVRVHHSVLAQLGTADGEPVRVSSSRGSIVVPGIGDPGLPAGTAVLAWNMPGVAPNGLIDSGAAVTEVRVEVAEGGDDRG